MNKQYKTLIIGSTFYGVSRLMQSPDNCLLVDKGMLIGSEFCDSLNERIASDADLKSDFARKFAKDLKDRGYMDGEGHIYPAPSVFLLADYLNKADCNVMLGTEVLDIKKVQLGYEVTLFNSDGKTVIHTEKIIDTTCDRNEADTYAKSINFVVYNPSDFLMENITYNPLSDLYIYKFPVDKEDSYFDAKKKLYDFWQTNAKKVTDSRIVHIATTFAYDMPLTKEEVDSGYMCIPSVGFGDILSAIDAGWEGDL